MTKLDPQAFDFQARDASPVQVAAAMSQSGCVVIREAVDPEILQYLAERAHARLNEVGRQQVQIWDVEEDIENPGFWPIRVLRRPLILSVIQAYLRSDRIIVSLPHAIFRNLRAASPERFHPFHQEERTGIFYERELTCWFPLKPDPSNSGTPGFEWILGLVDEILPVENDSLPAPAGTAIETGLERRLLTENSVWRPELKVGDIVLFDGRSVSRMSVETTAADYQVSCAVRCWPKNDKVMETFAHPDVAAWFEINKDEMFGPVRALDIFHDDGSPKWQLGSLDPDAEFSRPATTGQHEAVSAMGDRNEKNAFLAGIGRMFRRDG